MDVPVYLVHIHVPVFYFLLIFLKVLGESRPDKFGCLLRWYDEIYTGLDFVLQNYYLHKYSMYYES